MEIMEEKEVVPEKEVRVVRRRSAYPAPPQPAHWSAWIGLPGMFLLGLGLGWMVWGSSSAASAPVVQGVADATRYKVSVDNDPSIGPADAPVTIIELSDFQ